MTEEAVFRLIESCRLIAVTVIDDKDHAVPMAEALLAGGVKVIELTMRTPATIPALREIRKHVPEMLVGLGTILQPKQVLAAIDAGAAFGVSPGTNARVIEAAAENKLPFAPGVCVPSDIELALEFDCRVLKFFPAKPSGGLPYLQCIASPYEHLGVRYIPLGGLTESNMPDYLREPIVSAIGGSWLAPRNVIREKDWPIIKANAARAIHVVQTTPRKEH